MTKLSAHISWRTIASEEYQIIWNFIWDEDTSPDVLKQYFLYLFFLLHHKKDLDIDLKKYLVITNGMKTMDERIQ